MRCIGDITLKGIDGSVEATSDKGNINIGINNLTDGSRTTAYTDGCVTAVINPEVSFKLFAYFKVINTLLIFNTLFN